MEATRIDPGGRTYSELFHRVKWTGAWKIIPYSSDILRYRECT